MVGSVSTTARLLLFCPHPVNSKGWLPIIGVVAAGTRGTETSVRVLLVQRH